MVEWGIGFLRALSPEHTRRKAGSISRIFLSTTAFDNDWSFFGSLAKTIEMSINTIQPCRQGVVIRTYGFLMASNESEDLSITTAATVTGKDAIKIR